MIAAIIQITIAIALLFYGGRFTSFKIPTMATLGIFQSLPDDSINPTGPFCTLPDDSINPTGTFCTLPDDSAISQGKIQHNDLASEMNQLEKFQSFGQPLLEAADIPLLEFPTLDTLNALSPTQEASQRHLECCFETAEVSINTSWATFISHTSPSLAVVLPIIFSCLLLLYFVVVRFCMLSNTRNDESAEVRMDEDECNGRCEYDEHECCDVCIKEYKNEIWSVEDQHNLLEMTSPTNNSDERPQDVGLLSPLMKKGKKVPQKYKLQLKSEDCQLLEDFYLAALQHKYEGKVTWTTSCHGGYIYFEGQQENISEVCTKMQRQIYDCLGKKKAIAKEIVPMYQDEVDQRNLLVQTETSSIIHHSVDYIPVLRVIPSLTDKSGEEPQDIGLFSPVIRRGKKVYQKYKLIIKSQDCRLLKDSYLAALQHKYEGKVTWTISYCSDFIFFEGQQENVSKVCTEMQREIRDCMSKKKAIWKEIVAMYEVDQENSLISSSNRVGKLVGFEANGPNDIIYCLSANERIKRKIFGKFKQNKSKVGKQYNVHIDEKYHLVTILGQQQNVYKAYMFCKEQAEMI